MFQPWCLICNSRTRIAAFITKTRAILAAMGSGFLSVFKYTR